MPNKNLQLIADLLEKLDTKSQIEDFINTFKSVVGIFKAMKLENEKERKEIIRIFEDFTDKLKQTNKFNFESLKLEVLNKVDKKLSTVKDGYTPQKGKDYFDGVDGRNGKDGKDGKKGDKPDHKWEGTKLFFEKPDGEWGKGVDLKGDKGNNYSVFGGGGGGGAGKVVKSYDLSSSLNGVTKTFSLPAFYRVISVHLSSFPNILRPTTDYTVNGSTFQITFTDQITADSSLASGQTLLIVYSEP